MNPAPAPAMHPSATIERVETVLLDLPTIRPHRLSVATMNGQTLMLVRIHCSDGVVGVGEGTTIRGMAYGGESPAGTKPQADTSFATLLRGADPPHHPPAMHPPAPIERVETVLLDLPTIRPHRLSVATMNGQTLMLVRIHCSDGVVGVGEGTTIGGLAYGGESPEGMKLAVDTYFAPLLRGADATRVPALMAHLDRAIKDNRFARSAIETALLDAHGKRTGLPVSELLGGRRRERLPVAWTLASGDTARDIAEAEQMLDLRRHNVFKLKIGARTLAEDIAHVAAIKRALGDRGDRKSTRLNSSHSCATRKHAFACKRQKPNHD